uniref:Uncharacterized protein n=1 Tax=Zea mays TaxID=4577 RepID=A0A0H4NYA5_MAIZE|nr:hypothetical protein [Zea mays]
MAATADPRAKPPPAASHHLKPWAPQPRPRARRVPPLPGPVVTGGGGARDRRRSSSSSSSSTSHRRLSADAGTVQMELPCDGQIKDPRAKLMGHLRPLPPPPPPPPPPKPQPRPPGPEPAAPLPQPTPSQPEEAAAARPWNLRDRKCRRPTARGAAAAAAAALDASHARDAAGAGAEKARLPVPLERAPFAVALTTEEVEDDVYALTGARPRRRPRKRPRVVQRQLDVRPIPHTAPRAPPITTSCCTRKKKT